MLNKHMQITKDVQRKLLREYFFIKGKINIDCNYFKEKMKIGFDENENLNYRTNVKGKMTSFKFFVNDKKFQKMVGEFNMYIDKYQNFHPYGIQDAWGFTTEPGEGTVPHDHLCLWSGVVYLNKCDQPLVFKEIDEQVDPEEGSFALFSPWLLHGCEPNTDTVVKWGMSFNMGERKSW